MKNLPPFKWFMLQNFPFIEYDFDAMTNYELMCKIVGYVQKVADETNENSAEIQKLIEWTQTLDLQDEVDNKLDEMALDGTLAHIINEEIFNELNSMVQADNLLLNDQCKIYFPYRGQNAGDCSVIQNADKTIVIDIGINTSQLVSWLVRKGITHIDYLIISHYHIDHIGNTNAEGFFYLLYSEYELVDSDTVVYLPHKGIDWSQITASDKAAIMADEARIKSELTTLNIPYVEPDNNQLLVLSEICHLKFMNIGATYYTSYYGTYQEYNNFSMVVELTHNNRHALFTGDIMREAQNNMAPLIHEPDILKAPHHDLESVVNEPFLHKCTSKIMVFMEWFASHGNGTITPFAQTVHNNGGKVYDTNNSQNVTIILKNDNIISNADYGCYSLHSSNIYNGAGIHLANNTNLNDIRTNGNYFTNNNDETKTLQNLPMASIYSAQSADEDIGRCKLIVSTYNLDNNITVQTFMYGDSIWIRDYDNASWKPWKRISGDDILDVSDKMIPANGDLNDYLQAGRYLILNNDVLNTIDNIPASNVGGSILLVMTTRIWDNIVHQIFISASNAVYIRTIQLDHYNEHISSATNWFELDKTEIVPDE